MRKCLIIIFFLLGILLTAFPQDQKVFHSSVSLNHDFNILNHKTNHHICNHFLKEIARGNGKNAEDITYSIRYTRIIDIYRISEEDAIVEVTYKLKAIFGDVVFRDFDISEFLNPAKVELVLDYSTNGKDHNRRIHFDDIPLDGSTVSKRVSLRAEQTKLFAEVKGQSFIYSTVEQDKFDGRIALIDDYFASNAILDTALNILYRIDLQDRDDLTSTFLDLLETGNIIDHLQEKNIKESLDLNHFDPLGYQRTLTILKYRHSSLLDDFDDNLTNKKILVSKDGIRNIVAQYISHYTKYFELSNRLHFYSGNTYWPLGRVIITNRTLARYKSGVDKLVQTVDQDGRHGEMIYAFTHHLYNEWIEMAQMYLDKERYAEAANILGNAKGLCDYLASVHCTMELFQYATRAKEGIFNSYIRIAEKGLLAFQPEISENYLIKAYNFQENNSAYILSNLKVKSLLDELMETYFHQIDIDLNSGYYEDALGKLERVQNLDQKYFNLANIEKIGEKKTVAQQGYYEKMVVDAVVYLELNNFMGAEQQLSQAKNYQALYSDRIIPAHLTDSIELVLQQKEEEYHYQDAVVAQSPQKTIIPKPYTKTVKPKKPEDPLLKDCHKYQLTYYKLYLETKKALDEEAYISGGDLLDELRRYNADDTTCYLQKKDLTNISAKYQPLIDYSRKARDFKRIVQEKSYDYIPVLISDLELLYGIIESNGSEIKKITLEELCLEFDDPDLFVFAANYFIIQGDYLKSIAMLRELKFTHIPDTTIGRLQITLAELVATVDYADNPDLDPKKQVEKYTSGDKWLSVFKKTYLQNWGKSIN